MPPDAVFFSSETLVFLRQLKANNNRDWFQAHKATYESAVKQPMLAFAAALSDRMATVAPDYATAPEKAIQRIYRDVRFSADKTPYRTELGMLFTHRALGKKAGSGIYVAIGPDAVQVAGGLYQQDAPGLYAVRQYLVDHQKVFEKLLRSKGVQANFGSLTGDSLKRPPRGFEPTHAAIEIIKRTQWLQELKMPAESACEAEFLTKIWAPIQGLLPFVRFFEAPLLVKAKPIMLD